MPKRVRDFVFPFLMITLGAQVLFNLGYSLLGISSAIESHRIPEFLLVAAGYIVLGILLVYMLRFTTTREVYWDTLKATLLTVPLMGFMIIIGIQFSDNGKWIQLLIGAALSVVAGSLFVVKKANWVYWLSLIYVDILALSIVLLNIQI